jgi:hypothetical protein
MAAGGGGLRLLAADGYWWQLGCEGFGPIGYT